MGRIRDPELGGELRGDGARRPRAPDHEQAADRRLIAKVRPAIPGRKRGRLLGLPADQLLEPPELALELAGDEHSFSRIVERDVDPSARRPAHGHLGGRAPPGVERPEEELQHRRGVAVAHDGAGVRVEAGGEIEAERDPEPGPRVEAGIRRPSEDPRDEAMVHPGRLREPSRRDARVRERAFQVEHERGTSTLRRATSGSVGGSHPHAAEETTPPSPGTYAWPPRRGRCRRGTTSGSRRARWSRCATKATRERVAKGRNGAQWCRRCSSSTRHGRNRCRGSTAGRVPGCGDEAA